MIVGPDLVYRPMDGGWVGQRDQSHDRVVRRAVTEAEFTRDVKSTYGVLLTRGLRGCYVYFMDDVATLKALIAAGKVKPVIDRRFPMDEVVDALRWVDDGRARGKVVISV